MIDVLPGIYAKDWQTFARDVGFVASYAPWIHVDVLDGTMVEEVTVTDFSQLPQLKSVHPAISFEAHLIVANPEKYIKPLVDAGFSRLIAHIEANDPRRFLDLAKYEEIEVGLAMDGSTEIDEIEPFLEEVDFVAVLSAEAGSPGQKFLPEALEKIKLIRQNYPDLPIEVIGGITDVNARSVKEAGATRVVATSFIFKSPEHAEAAIEQLKNI